MRNDVERFLFLSFSSAGLLRDCIFPSTRNHEYTCQIFEGDDDGTSRVNVFLVYASRKRHDEERSPSGRFRTGSFSRQHAIALPLLMFGTSRLSHHVATKRDSAATARASVMHSNANISLPWGHGVIVAISCFSEIQPALHPVSYNPFCIARYSLTSSHPSTW